MTDDGLRVDGVRKSFGGRAVLRGVELTVPRGEAVAVVGPSGCGKTTLLRVVAGFETPDDGTVAIGDRVVTGGGRDVPAHRRGIGYVPQDGALFPHLTVGGNVGFGLPRRERTRDRIAGLLERVSLTPDLARLRPDQLSGGQQQRVAVARALAQSPGVVLLDEPFSALDAGLRGELRASVADVLRSAGVTTLLVTHDQEEALSFADRVAVLRDGVFAQVGWPWEVYLTPSDDGVAEFFGEQVHLTARMDGDRAITPLGTVALSVPPGPDGVAGVQVRTEQVVVGALGVPGAPGRDGVPGRVDRVTFLGPTVRCEMTVAGVGPVVARCRPQDAPRAGDDVVVSVVGAGRPVA